MDCWADEVSKLESGDRIALWHALTGRHVVLAADLVAAVEACPAGQPPPPLLAGVFARLERLSLLRGNPPPEVPDLVPARSRLVLTLPQEPALWLPMPAARTSGRRRNTSAGVSRSTAGSCRGRSCTNPN